MSEENSEVRILGEIDDRADLSKLFQFDDIYGTGSQILHGGEWGIAEPRHRPETCLIEIIIRKVKLPSPDFDPRVRLNPFAPDNTKPDTAHPAALIRELADNLREIAEWVAMHSSEKMRSPGLRRMFEDITVALAKVGMGDWYEHIQVQKMILRREIVWGTERKKETEA